jgi:hypothetical protein
MKNNFLFSAILMFLLVGFFNPASKAQTFSMWTQNAVLNGNAWSFDVMAQSTSGAPISIYSYQIGFIYTAAAKGTGTLTAAWSNVDANIQSQEAPKAVSCTVVPYVKCGFNVNSGGSGSGVPMPSATALRIGTLTITNTVAWVSAPGLLWYFGGGPAGGLLTKINATDGTLAYDNTANGVYTMDAALPVELSSFTSAIQGRTVVLNWETKTEVNSNRYVIERSLVSTNTWSAIASVQANGNSNSPKKYTFTDTKLQSGKYQYRLKMVDNDGSYKYSSVEAAEVAIPKDFQVSQNYPNPFNPSTKIDYQVPVDAKVLLEVYNIAGQKVVELVNQTMSAGYYTVDFGASKLSSGVYIYRLAASDAATGNNFSAIKKMMLLK